MSFKLGQDGIKLLKDKFEAGCSEVFDPTGDRDDEYEWKSFVFGWVMAQTYDFTIDQSRDVTDQLFNELWT